MGDLPDQESSTAAERRTAHVQALREERQTLTAAGNPRRLGEVEAELATYDPKPGPGKPGTQKT